MESAEYPYIIQHWDEMIELLKTLVQIPAPSNLERKRAEFCKLWLEKQGANGVWIDDADNVIYPVGCTADNPLVVFMAHTDTVFPNSDIPLTEEGGKLKAPGIGDDTANLVVLLMAAKYITQSEITPNGTGILFVANSGEEGLGNLRGSRKIVSAFGSRIREFYSFDGYSGLVMNRSVGSRRYRTEILAEGGHSYMNFGNRSAVAYLASMIGTLYTFKVPSIGKATYNVGTISGGTSVNTIAQQAEMLYEFRADEKDALAVMEKHFNSVVECYRSKGIQVNAELIGDRPCMSEVDGQKMQALADKVSRTIRKHLKTEPNFVSGSTDCNIPLSVGIPSICLGCCVGDGAHTRDEWIQTDSLHAGMAMALDLILEYFQ